MGQGQGAVRGHIRELDGLRGVAIALVLLHHFWPATGTLARWEEFAHLGWVGVDLFFVISGFLITGILLDTRGDARYFRNFYARRSLRIFPLYYLFLAAAFTVIPLLQRGPYWGSEFIEESGPPWWYVFYLGNVREALTGREPAYVLAPLWSLSIEEQFYITFPLIVAALPAARLNALLWLLVGFAPAFRLVTIFLWPSNERVQYLATPSRVDVIAWGGLLALGFRGGRSLPSPRVTGRLLLAAAGACAAAFALGGLNRMRPFCRTAGYSLVAVMFALLVLWAVQNRGRPSTAVLRFAPLRRLGILCYGTYLLQRPSEVALVKVLGRATWFPAEGSVSLMVLKCGTAVGVAWLSWHCFERPILGLKSAFASRHHPENAAVVTPPAPEPAA
jgi:peptidoglycan/LPS O-acetylase OafA/YrhL